MQTAKRKDSCASMTIGKAQGKEQATTDISELRCKQEAESYLTHKTGH